MPALLYGMKAWKKLSKVEIQQLEKIKVKPKKDIQSTNNNTLYWTNN